MTTPSRLLWPLILVILGFNIGIYGAGFGIGAGIFHLFATIAVCIALPHQKRTPGAYALAAVSAVAGLLVCGRANSFVQGFSFLVANASLLFLLILHSLGTFPQTIWQALSAIGEFAAANTFGLFRVFDVMAKTNDEGKHAFWKNPFNLLKTAAISVVVLGVFVFLLTQADPIFAQMVKRVLEQSLGRIIWSLIVAFVAVSVLTIVLDKRKQEHPELRFLAYHDVLVPSVLLAILFGGFLSIQARYLFASHDVFLQFGLKYAEYVRKGFIELLVATFFGSIVSYILIAKQHTLKTRYIPWINMALLIELGLLLASAWRRDLMYIEVYGLTRIRIIGEVLLFWLLGELVILFLLTSWKKFTETHALIGLGAISLGALLYFNGVNMDMRIVHAAQARQEKQDLFSIANLSEDAYDGWKSSIETSKQLFRVLQTKQSLSEEELSRLANIKLALLSLVAQRERLEKKFGTSASKWQEYTISEYLAYERLKKDRAYFYDEVNALLSDIALYQHTYNVSLSAEERFILRENKYPFMHLKIRYPVGR